MHLLQERRSISSSHELPNPAEAQEVHMTRGDAVLADIGNVYLGILKACGLRNRRSESRLVRLLDSHLRRAVTGCRLA